MASQRVIDSLRPLWPLATFILFIVSLGGSVFRFILAMQVLVEFSKEREEVLRLVMFNPKSKNS